MMYCPTRRVVVACDPVGHPVDTRRSTTMPRHRDVDAVPAHLDTGHHPLVRVDGSLPTARSDDQAQVETLALLEAAAIALGAAELSPESIRAARVADRELRACRQDPSTAVRWARLFHHTLLDACPNRHMRDLIDVESLGAGAPARRLSIGVDELSRVADDHDAILDLIATGAPCCELERSLRRHASRSTLCSMALLGS